MIMNTDYEIIEKDGLFALLNKKNKTQSGFEFSEIIPISEKSFSCCKENEYYILGSQCKIISESSQQHYRWFFSDRILAKRNDKYGFINITNSVTIPFKYDEIRLRGNIFDVRINNMWGIMNMLGNELTHIKYSEPIVYTTNSIAIVVDSLSGRKGVLDICGNEIIPCIYTYIMQDNNNPEYIYVAIDGRFDKQNSNFFSGHISFAYWGCFDIKGKLIIPVSYDCIKIIGEYCYAGWLGNFLEGIEFMSHNNLTEYSGVYDLYNKDGKFLIGGFDLFNTESGILFFHFGGKWISNQDKYGQHRCLFESGNGKWVVSDSNLDSLILLNGDIYNIAQNGKRVFCKQVKFEKPKTPSILDSSTKQIYYEMVFSLPNEILFDMPENERLPHLKNENVIIIGRTGYKRAIFVKEKMITDYFSEIEAINDTFIFVKKDGKCGILELNNTIISLKYFAMTYPVCGYVLAVQDIGFEHYQCILIDLNDLNKKYRSVYDKLDLVEIGKKFRSHYLMFQIMNLEENVLLENLGLGGYDDEDLNQEFRKIIYAQANIYDDKISRYWFPSNNMNYQESECSLGFNESQESYNYEESWEDDDSWNDADTWDAMTDGMYGDYPGSDVDYDKFGF